MTNTELCEAMGISPRLMGLRLVDLVKRYGLQLRVENQGRQIHNRLFAPPGLLAPGGAPQVRAQTAIHS